MAKLDAAVFTIRVDNEQEITAWIAEMGKLREAIEAQFKEMLRLCQERPLIHMSINQGETLGIDGTSEP